MVGPDLEGSGKAVWVLKLSEGYRSIGSGQISGEVSAVRDWDDRDRTALQACSAKRTFLVCIVSNRLYQIIGRTVVFHPRYQTYPPWAFPISDPDYPAQAAPEVSLWLLAVQ